MRAIDSQRNSVFGARIALTGAAIAALCVGLLPQAAFAVAEPPASEETAAPSVVDEVPGDVVEPLPVPGGSQAPDAADELPVVPDEVVPVDEAPEDLPADDAVSEAYRSPLNGDYPGSSTIHEADPGDYSATRISAYSTRSLAGFRAGNIISDANMYTSGTMSVAEIQAFLNARLSSCDPGYTCLKDFRQTTTTQPANAYCSGTYQGASNETAAQIISKVSRACNVSEKVLLVKLQKEQGLITHRAPTQVRYDRAMGFACPDTGPGNSANCDSAYAGFGYQMYMAARQLQRYTKDSYFSWFPVGRTSQIQWHPNASCGSGPVHIENNATAALYYYTPYQPNQAALNAGYGTGNSCSAYGNRNFYLYYTDWFGSTGSTNPCEVPSDVHSAQHQYVVTAAALNARKAPTTACSEDVFTLSQGTIVQALRATSDTSWIEVQTLQGRRWISMDHVRRASAAEAGCVLPAGTSSAHREYVVSSATTAKIAPWAACTLDAQTLAAGTVLQASRVSATGRWLEVLTKAGPRWVERSALSYSAEADRAAVCTDPAGTSTVSQAYVVRTGTMAWLSPLERCNSGKTVQAGHVLHATRLSYSGLWLEVQTQNGARWIARDAVEPASASDIAAVCVDPAGTRGASLQYVVRESTLAWMTPLERCTTGTRHIGAGTAVQATRISASGNWLEIQTAVGERWVPRSTVAECRQPAGTRNASKRYIVREDVDALITPLAECSTDVRNWGAGTTPPTVLTGTVLQATRVSASGNWLEVQTTQGQRWVARDAVDECANPAGTRTASRQYVVRTATQGLVSPLAECGTAPRFNGAGTEPLSMGAGRVLQATRISASGRWLEVHTQAGRRWVPREDVEYASTAQVDAACTQPAGTRTATKQYVAQRATVGWLSPLERCGAHTRSIGAGTVLQATRVSASGLWLEVRTSVGPRWVWRADVRER